MLIYPSIDPIAFSLGPLHVHWYGLMYLFGFIGADLLARFRVKRYHAAWTNDDISDLIFYAAIGVIVGGRMGYLLFYQTHALIHTPWIAFKLWEGGMSFHGGFIGVIMALWAFKRKTHKPFWAITDFVAPLVPFGLMLGRLGNFINGELWGRISTVPWAMVFPEAGPSPRHPSQLYELGLEGIGLMILLWCYSAKPRPAGSVSAVFLMGYASSRMIIECFREPDPQLGFIAFHSITMGQLLSLPMLLLGLFIWWKNRHENLSNVS